MASKLYKYLNYIQGFSLDRIIKDYDPNKVYKYNDTIYTWSGFWRYSSASPWKMNLYRVYQKSIMLIYGVACVFFLIDAIIVRNDIDKLSFNMSSSVLVFTKLMQIFLLSGLKKDIEGMREKLDNHFHVVTVGKSEEDKSILKQKAELILKVSIMFYSLLLMGLPLRVIADTTLGVKGYLIPMPFKESLEDYYNYVYAQQVVISFHFMVTTLSYDLIGFSFIVRFIGHYDILEKNFRKIKSLYPRINFEKYVRGYVEIRHADDEQEDILIRKTNYSEKTEKFFKSYKLDRFHIIRGTNSQTRREEKTYQLLKENVYHHQKLLTGIRCYFDMYSQSFLIQIGGMVILLGIVAIQALFLSDGITLLLVQQLIYACTTLFNILCLCSFGSELTSKSISVTHALYDTPWYEMNSGNRNAVCLILQKLSLAPVLKGGRMVTIDRVTCVKFLQSSYNMVALMRNKL